MHSLWWAPRVHAAIGMVQNVVTAVKADSSGSMRLGHSDPRITRPNGIGACTATLCWSLCCLLRRG